MQADSAQINKCFVLCLIGCVRKTERNRAKLCLNIVIHFCAKHSTTLTLLWNLLVLHLSSVIGLAWEKRSMLWFIQVTLNDKICATQVFFDFSFVRGWSDRLSMAQTLRREKQLLFCWTIFGFLSYEIENRPLSAHWKLDQATPSII